jgi:hypothetical protein
MMTDPQSGLTFEEHRELSHELVKTQRRLEEFGSLANDVYGSESRTSIAFIEAAEAVGRLRYHLQLQANDDCPGERADDLYR